MKSGKKGESERTLDKNKQHITTSKERYLYGETYVV